MPLPHLFMRHYRQLGLSATLAMFVMQLMESTWDLGDPPRTVGDLARRMGVDPRTIRKYSEEVAGLELIRLYDQFDASGAQVENGYDLSPLFQRLAHLAPEPAPTGTFRHRQARGSVAMTAETTPRTVSVNLADPPGSNDPPPPGSNDPAPRIERSTAPDQTITPRADQAIIPGPDSLIQAPRSKESGLNKEQRKTKKHQERMLHDGMSKQQGTPEHATAPLLTLVPPTNPPQSPAAGMGPHLGSGTGFSLRWQQPLSEAEVQATSWLLQRMGIDQPVRRLLAPSLAPAEAWGLWVYAQAKRWRVPLLVSQIYDKQRKIARPAADLLPHHDALGAALHAIQTTTAEAIVQLVSAHCPSDPQAVLNSPLVTQADAQVREVVEQVWALIAELRDQPGTPLRPMQQTLASSSRPETMNGETWSQVLKTVRPSLAGAEFATWLEPTLLLALEPDRAVIGTPNVFVRQEVEAHYAAMLAQALQEVIGRPVELAIVIGSV